MRDKLRDQGYFKKYIDKEIYYMDLFIKDVDGVELEERGQKMFNATIDLHLRNILIAKYSMGVDLNALKEDYLNSISALEKTWRSESMYVQIVWVLSMGILLEIEDEVFDKLVALEENDSTNDYLVDYLITYRRPGRKISEDVKWPTPYKIAKEVTQRPKKEEAEKHLKLYLEKKV